MIFTKEMMLKAAKNARLGLSEKEIEEFLPQIKEIISAVSEISGADTKDAGQCIHPVSAGEAMRDDKPVKSLGEEDIFSGTRLKKNGYFMGPKLL